MTVAALLAGLLVALPAAGAPPRVVGWLEAAVFPDARLRVVAKLDTGAKTSALDAERIAYFQRDGAKWVRFELRRRKGREPRTLEGRVVGEKRIRTSVGEEVRPLVDLWLCLAGERRRVLFSLSGRAGMNYRVLLGRRALEGRVAVDASRKFTVEPGCESE